MNTLQVRRLGYAAGAQVTDVDLTQPVGDAVIAEIHNIWLEHHVLCFPNQDLTKENLLAVATRFGELVSMKKTVYPDPLTDGISLLTNKEIDGKPWNGKKSGVSWHSDKSYTTQPSAYTLVNCKETPPAGGDTQFANLYRAYETLSPAMQHMLSQLEAVHVSPRYYRMRNEVPSAQPLIRIHPETKRKALYVGDRARTIVGMTEEESRPLLDFLNQHAVRYEFIYRHRWTVGDLVMWDNRCLLHKALCDYDLRNDPRLMFRCEVLGTPSGTAYTGELPAEAGSSGGQHVLLEPAAT